MSTTVTIAALRLRQVGLEIRLKAAREDCAAWLDMTAMACYREMKYLEAKGDVADGEIKAPWGLLQEAIAKLREAQEEVKINLRRIEDAESDLAE